jgi:three-Cys-motif partner protein
MENESYHGREQSQVKHRVLERYLKAFAPIIGRWHDEIVYVDCMAGPWEARNPSLSDTSFHTAISVFRDCKQRGRCKSVRVLLIENNLERFAQLEAYGRSITDMEVVTRQWDFCEHVEDVVRFAKQSSNSFPFFFIDPTGWDEVRPNLIAPILRVNPGEVLINFMSEFVKRFLCDPTKPFDQLLGDDLERLRCLEGNDLEDELVNTYTKLVRRVGNYDYTCAIPILKPNSDAILYHLIYGTRSFKGLEEFKHTEADAIPHMHEIRAGAQRRRAEESSSQGFLLPPEETYREKRFQGFHERRLANARAAVIELLSRRPSVTYEDIYRESMQYSTVLVDDLREWLAEWNAEGKICYGNWAKGQRVPQPKTIVERRGILS